LPSRPIAGAIRRVAIVTGAAQGLGRVIAKRLAEEGAKLRARTARGDRHGRRRSEAGVADHIVERALAAYGQIDTLVNNTAALIRLRLTDFTEELMQKAVRWNVWNTLRCCKAVLPHMLERRYGRIVNIGGEAWRTGAPYHAAGRNRQRLDGRPDDHPCRRIHAPRDHGQLRFAGCDRNRGRRCRRKIEMSPGVQSRNDTPLAAETTSATLHQSQTQDGD
jgi:hypothetical protein